MDNHFSDSILSPSFINLYIDCPHAAFLRYHEKHQPYFIDDTYIKIGKSGHSILQNFYGNINLNAPDIENEFMEKMKITAFKYWDRTIDSQKRDDVEPAFFNWLKYEIQRYMNYKKQGCLDRFMPIAVEQTMKDYPNKIMSIIDKRAMGVSGIQYCIDYKFNKNLPAQRNFEGRLDKIDLPFKIQAALNAQVLKANDINIGSFFYQFVRYPEKLLQVPLTSSLFDEVNQIITTIRQDTEFKKNPKSCFMCNFKMHCRLESRSVHCL